MKKLDELKQELSAKSQKMENLYQAGKIQEALKVAEGEGKSRI